MSSFAVLTNGIVLLLVWFLVVLTSVHSEEGQISRSSSRNTLALPTSPCPDTFQYMFDGEKYTGQGTIRPGEYTNNQEVELVVVTVKHNPEFYTFFKKKFKMELTDIVLDLMNNNQSIPFTVHFTSQNHIYGIARILVNSKVICSDPALHDVISSFNLTQLEMYTGNETFYTINRKEGVVLPLLHLYEAGCGTVQRHITPLVYGGKTLNKGDWPFVAALKRYDDSSLIYQCGATIISERAVISAAHCFFDKGRALRAEDVWAFIGQHNLKRIDEGGSQIVSLERIDIHPDYNKNNDHPFYSDIAIGRLSKTLIYSDFIQPACLWTGDYDQSKIVGQNGVLVGWGLDETGVVTDKPKKVEIPIVSELNCVRSHEVLNKITSDRTLCAGWRNGSEGPCNGDSGSGLLVNQDGLWFLRGLVSQSLAVRGKCDLNEFVVFTDVGKFASWIIMKTTNK